MPELYIITGSNGAGKSTFGSNYLPSNIQKRCIVFDGDKLYMQKQRDLWKEGIKAIKEAKKIAINFVRKTFEDLVYKSINNNSDFVYEGHFTNEATWDIPKKFKASGYKIHLLFFGLANIKESEIRVNERVKVGGHYVYPKTVSDNFYGNLDKYFSIFDSVEIIDSTKARQIQICKIVSSNVESSINFLQIPNWFKVNLPRVSNLIKESKNI